MNIILFGFKSCGKTHFGKKLSFQLSRPFIDTDQMIEEEYALLYRARSGLVNFDSAKQSQIEAKRSERRSPAPSGQGEKEDRFSKVAAGQNPPNLSGRGIEQEQVSCREIFLKLGDEGFRAIETQVLAALQNVQNCIISVGGGMILHRSNVEILEKMGRLIYLSLDKETLKKKGPRRNAPLLSRSDRSCRII